MVITEKKFLQKKTELEHQHFHRMVKFIEAIENTGDVSSTKIINIIAQTQGADIKKEWENIAIKEGRNRIDDLIRLLWKPLKHCGFEFDIISTAGEVNIKCTKCPWHNLSQNYDDPKWLFHLTCGADFFIVEGFNPQIGFERTKTLMEGYDHCNHRYFYKTNE